MNKVLKAGCILINIKEKKIALVYREKQQDYSFPKGHLEENESLIECALRETTEETKRECRLLEEESIYIEEYLTSSGEDVKLYYFLAEDIGLSKNICDDTHPTFWLPFEEVYDKLSYPSLKKVWNAVKEKAESYCNKNN